MLANTQALLMTGIGVAVFAMMLWAFLDALRTRADAFPAAGKKTKPFWLLLTGGAAAIGFVHLGPLLGLGTTPFSIFNLVAIIAAAVYLTDVRPALRQIRIPDNGNTNMGPYGPW